MPRRKNIYVEKHHIDDTEVVVDNRDLTTTMLQYEDRPRTAYVIDTRFALWIVENALENADVPERLYKEHVAVLERLLNASEKAREEEEEE